jgi:hypothetical protein
MKEIRHNKAANTATKVDFVCELSQKLFRLKLSLLDDIFAKFPVSVHKMENKFLRIMRQRMRRKPN